MQAPVVYEMQDSATKKNANGNVNANAKQQRNCCCTAYLHFKPRLSAVSDADFKFPREVRLTPHMRACLFNNKQLRCIMLE
jgi:hypothetical protein